MTLDNLDYDIEIAIKAVKASGELLLENRDELNNETVVSSKDIKLKADVSSENLIKEIILANSTYPILAEESGKSKYDLGETFWVIDPLDGTANYNRDIPITTKMEGIILCEAVFSFKISKPIKVAKMILVSRIDET